MKKRAFIFLLSGIFWITVSAGAQDLAHSPGAFVDVGFGARALGMSGAFVAAGSDAQALLWNPAGLGGVARVQGTLSTTRQFGLIPYNLAAVAFRISPALVPSVGVIVSGDETLREETFLAGLSYERRLGGSSWIRGGVALGFRSANFGNDAAPETGAVTGGVSGFSADLGAQVSPARHAVLAVVLKNAVNYLQWDSSISGKYSEGMPRRLIFGLGAVDISQFNFDLDFEKALYRDVADRFSFGLERPFYRYFVLRGGFTRGLAPSDFLSTAVGGGLRYAFPQGFLLNLDVAYIFQDLNNNFRLSVSFDLK